jgi:hypothetical protein
LTSHQINFFKKLKQHRFNKKIKNKNKNQQIITESYQIMGLGFKTAL